MYNATININNPKCDAKLAAHWTLFKKLWKQSERLFKEFGELPIANEWPIGNGISSNVLFANLS